MAVYAADCPDGQVEQVNPFTHWADCDVSAYGSNIYGTEDNNGNWFAHFYNSSDFISVKGTAYCLAEERSIPTEPTGTCGTYPLPIVDEVDTNVSGNHCWCRVKQYKPFATNTDVSYQNVYAKYIQLPDTDTCNLNACAERCASIGKYFDEGIGGDLIHTVTGLRGDVYKSVKKCKPVENKITYIDDSTNNVIYAIQDYTPGQDVTLLTHLNKDKFVFVGWCEKPGCANPKSAGTKVSGLSGEKMFYAKWQPVNCDTGVLATINNGVVTCTSQCDEGFEQQQNPFTGKWSNCEVSQHGDGFVTTSLNGEWAAGFGFRDFIMVKGKAYCLQEQYAMPSQKGVCDTSSLPVVENVDTNSAGSVCWCQVTEWQPFTVSRDAPFQKVSAKYIQMPVINETCNLNDCGARCAEIGENVIVGLGGIVGYTNIGLRGDVYKSIKKCIPIEYTFTFDVGEDSETVNPLEYTYNDLPFNLPMPHSGNNKHFVGWYDNEDLIGNPIVKIEDISHGTKTLYARWTNECEAYQKPIVNSQNNIVCTNVCNEWESVQASDVVSYEYNCVQNEYTVTFDTNNTDTIESIRYVYNDLPIALPEPLAKQNKVFVGWYDEDNNKIQEITTNSYGDKNLTARWEDITCESYQKAVVGSDNHATCETMCEKWQHVQNNPFSAGFIGKAYSENKMLTCSNFISNASCSTYTQQTLPNNYWQAAFPINGISSLTNFSGDTTYIQGVAVTSASGPTTKIPYQKVCDYFGPYLPTADNVEFDENGNHCWCKMTGYGQIVSGGNVDSIQNVSAQYMYTGVLTNNQTCSERCQRFLCETNTTWFGPLNSSYENKSVNIYSGFNGYSGDVYGARATIMNTITQCASNEYSITYNIDGQTVSNLEPKTYYPGDNVLSLPTPILDTGKTFLGWCDDGTTTCEKPLTGRIAVGEGTDWIKNKTLNAKWEYDSYKIKYEHGKAGDRTIGFTGTMDDSGAIYGTNVSLRENAFAIPGYSFDEWLGDYDNETGNMEQTPYENNEVLNPYHITNDLTLIAQWVPEDYTINYTCGSGQYKEGISTYSQTPTFDSAYTMAGVADVCAERAGYTMDGWDCDYVLPNEIWTVPNDVNCVAKWNPKSYEIQYENIESLNNPYNPTTYLTWPVKYVVGL